MVNCPYSTRCSSEGTCCGHCGNNQSIKEDYFIPRHKHYHYHPFEYPYIRWGTGTPGTSQSSPGTKTSYYQQK